MRKNIIAFVTVIEYSKEKRINIYVFGSGKTSVCWAEFLSLLISISTFSPQTINLMQDSVEPTIFSSLPVMYQHIDLFIPDYQPVRRPLLNRVSFFLFPCHVSTYRPFYSRLSTSTQASVEPSILFFFSPCHVSTYRPFFRPSTITRTPILHTVLTPVEMFPWAVGLVFL